MAGASMKDIKLRIRSVESTMQITKAMQLVATSKLRRAKERMERSKPYARVSDEALARVVAACDDRKAPFLGKKELHRRCYVVIGGERGLAGGYNANVFRQTAAHSEGIECCYLPIGKKAIDKYDRGGAEILSRDYPRVETLGVSGCYHLARLLIDGYNEGKYEEIWLVHTSFRTMMTQDVRTLRLLPIDTSDVKRTSCTTLYDPDPETVLQSIMPDYLAGRIYSALCDSFASEVAARRNAMDSATNNAGEMINQLRLTYNQARQSSITQEITEIVAGAEN